MPSFPTPTGPSVQSVARLDCLSCVCPKIAPPSFCQYRSPLPAAPCGTAFGMGLPTPIHVPPSWFLTTSTGFSSDTARVYCNALPTLGFTPFQVRRPELPRDAIPSSGCCPCPLKPSHRPKLRSSTSPPRERGLLALLPRDNVTGVLLRRSPLPLPPRPFPRRSGPVVAVARAFVSRLVR